MGDVTLEWDDNSDNEDGFCIEYKLSSSEIWSRLDSVDYNVAQYGPFSFAPPDTYDFRVYAYNADGISGHTNVLSVVFNYPTPDSPYNLNASPVTPYQIDLSWQYSNDPPVDGFYLERKIATGSYQRIDTLGLVTTYPDSGLSPSTTYLYRVIAFNSTGNSDPSDEVGATTLPPEETISKPGTPAGETNPNKDVSYTYTTSGATSNLGHTVEYSFDWGDGTSSSWSTSKSASHAWSSTGSKTVTVTARCQAHPDKTSTSEGLSVEVGETPSPPIVTELKKHDQYQLQFSWSEVANATGYNVYRSNEAFFTPDKENGSNRIAENVNDIDPAKEGVQWIDSDHVVGNPNENHFYVISASSQNVEGEYSARVGEFDFALVSTPTTSFNEIALFFVMPGINNAQELMSAIPGCNAVARWNANLQCYDQYIPGVPPTNFTVEMGHPYYVNVTADAVLTLLGELVNPSFSLVTTATTNFNEIVLPLDKTHITKASELMADIPSCNGVAYWNASIQAYEQYVPGILPTDFDLRVGYPYYVNVTADVSWPGDGTAKSNTIQENPQTDEDTQAPHVVWGRMSVEGRDVQEEEMGFTAFVTARPEETLTEQSSGCTIKDGCWIVQCGAFPSPWRAGEVLHVEFQEKDGDQKVERKIELTYNPVDEADEIIWEEVQGLPNRYRLNQNYPNPFNPETTIPYEIPEDGEVRISIYNMLGQEVRILVNERMRKGYYEVVWDGRDNRYEIVSSGMYLVRMEFGTFAQSRKILFVQ